MNLINTSKKKKKSFVHYNTNFIAEKQKYITASTTPRFPQHNSTEDTWTKIRNIRSLAKFI